MCTVLRRKQELLSYIKNSFMGAAEYSNLKKNSKTWLRASRNVNNSGVVENSAHNINTYLSFRWVLQNNVLLGIFK